jgi:hypothetical protein
MLLAVVMVVAASVIYIIWRVSKRDKKKHIGLQISGGPEVITIFLKDTGYGEKGLYWVGKKLIHKITVMKYCLNHYIEIRWSASLKVIGHGNVVMDMAQIALPSKIKISRKQSMMLSKTPAQLIYTRLFRQSDGVAFPISRSIPSRESTGWDRFVSRCDTNGLGDSDIQEPLPVRDMRGPPSYRELMACAAMTGVGFAPAAMNELVPLEGNLTTYDRSLMQNTSV